MEDQEFYGDVDEIFKSQLSQNKIMIKDIEKNEVLAIDYSRVFFDSDMNIYKTQGTDIVKIVDPNFKAVVVKK